MIPEAPAKEVADVAEEAEKPLTESEAVPAKEMTPEEPSKEPSSRRAAFFPTTYNRPDFHR
jgi:hypothetical protein